jgi:hypothetical protein
MHVRGYLDVVLICISMITIGNYHFLLCLLTNLYFFSILQGFSLNVPLKEDFPSHSRNSFFLTPLFPLGCLLLSEFVYFVL